MTARCYVVAENLIYPPTPEGAEEASIQRQVLEDMGFANALVMEVTRDAGQQHYGISFGPYITRAEASRFASLASEDYGLQLGLVEVEFD